MLDCRSANEANLPIVRVLHCLFWYFTFSCARGYLRTVVAVSRRFAGAAILSTTTTTTPAATGRSATPRSWCSSTIWFFRLVKLTSASAAASTAAATVMALWGRGLGRLGFGH